MAVQVYSHAMKTEHTIVETVLSVLLSLGKFLLSAILFVLDAIFYDDGKSVKNVGGKSSQNGETFDEEKYFSQEREDSHTHDLLYYLND